MNVLILRVCDEKELLKGALMNKKNYINPRSYVHEATLFINPSKKDHKNFERRSKKPSFFLSFFFVVLFFASVLSYSFLASASNTEWEIDYNGEEDWIMIDAYGIVSANMFAISMNKEKCNELDVDFYFSSLGTNKADNGFKFISEIVEKPHNGNEYRNYENELFVKYSEQHGDHIVYLLDDGYLYQTEEWIESLSSFSPFSYKMTLRKHYDPEYDIDTTYILSDTDEVWDMTELGNVLSEEYRKCRFKNYNQLEL